MKTIKILAVLFSLGSVFTTNANNRIGNELQEVTFVSTVTPVTTDELDLSTLKKAEKTTDEQIIEDLQITESQLPKFVSLKTAEPAVKIPAKLLN